MTTSQLGYPVKLAWFDDLNRPIKQAEREFSGAFNATLTDYGLNGEVEQQSTPYTVGVTAPYFTAFEYDALHRPVITLSHVDVGGNGYVETDTTYSGRKTTTTVHDQAVALTAGGNCPTNSSLCLQTSRATNALGELMQTTESPVLNGAITTLTTNTWTEPQGHVVAITDPENALTTASYNALGQRTSSHDPDQGTWNFTYDALGELLTQTDARGVVTTVNSRDALGRTTEQQAVPPAALPAGMENERLVDRWTFDPLHGVGELGQQQRLRGPNRITPSANPEVWKENYGYETLTSRPSTITTTISEGAVQTLNTSMDYDANGRPNTHTYPSPNGANRLSVKKSYTNFGQLASLSNATTNAVYWTANAENEWGHITSETWLGALTGTHEDYDSTGQSKQRSWFGGGASDMFDYSYDRFGNLTSQKRSAAGANVAETYTYDALQRLTGSSRPSGQVAYAYTKSGNLTEKSDFGLATTNAYTYPSGKHGVTSVQLPQGLTATYSYDANGNVIGGNTLLATYDPDNRLRVIDRAYLLSGPGDKIFCNGFDNGTNNCTNPPGGGATAWTYGTNGERSTETSSQGLRFFGPDGYELINGQSKHELGPVVVTRVGASDTVTILLKDRLGSTATTLDGASATLRTYDAFGAARNGNMTPRFNGTLNLSETIHGFTDHTHADDVGLIHMKGRVYDPNLGRFLSVDPVVSNPLNSQSLNPYSYLANNPLSGTDPTGYAEECEHGGRDCTLTNVESISVYKDKKGTYVAVAQDNQGNMVRAEAITQSTGNGVQATQFSQKFLQAIYNSDSSAIGSMKAIGSDPSARYSGVDHWQAWQNEDAAAFLGMNGKNAVIGASGGAAGGFGFWAASTGFAIHDLYQGDKRAALNDSVGAALGGAAGGEGVLAEIQGLRGATLEDPRKVMDVSASAKSLGANPFQSKTAQEVAELLENRGYTPKGPDPAAGRGTYVNPKTSRGYHIDANHPEPKGPHVGVHRPRDIRDKLSPRDYPLEDTR